ncbi:putative fatty acyl-CoA reductase CG5065 [Neocloeon triangulifer]|uniref:putative fatty acyl-CoA reductase CG5065 n=1 Tax=Neocloeon triangulifer TaxID=2078957 RepID=UPI00286EE7AF|nr:putative fatty acyl-CoA reductase CG5065 [Neocloeon triangulifer]
MAYKMVDTSKWPTIPDMYRGRSIFITGGSGFMGKVLVEKLLYSCPDLEKIYLLLRPKRGLSEEARIVEMMKLPVFERIRNERPGATSKVVAIPGDLCAEGLGLSDEHRALLQREVSIVFHSAATLKLEAPLKDAIIQNTSGTAKMIELAKGMKKLEAFMHLSTAFCHVDHLVLEETTNEAPYEPEDLMKSVTWMNDEMLAELEKKVLPPNPNTYTFSKRLAETLIKRAEREIPVAICRPSIVVPSLKEPKPGWVDSLNGPVGILVAAGKGVLRSMHCNPDYHAQVIPVDIAINALISASWRRIFDKNKYEVQVFNITTGNIAPITWGEVVGRGKKHFHANPFEGAVWYPDGEIRSNKYMHMLTLYLFHWVPAILIDCLLFLFGQKRFMIRLQKKISFGLNLLYFFTTREWVFANENFAAMNKQMCPSDRETFFQDTENVDQDLYLKNVILGARQYCMKEDLSTLPAARRHAKRLWWVQQIFWGIIYFYIAYWIISWNDNAKQFVDTAIGSVKSGITGVVGSVFGGSSAK